MVGFLNEIPTSGYIDRINGSCPVVGLSRCLTLRDLSYGRPPYRGHASRCLTLNAKTLRLGKSQTQGSLTEFDISASYPRRLCFTADPHRQPRRMTWPSISGKSVESVAVSWQGGSESYWFFSVAEPASEIYSLWLVEYMRLMKWNFVGNLMSFWGHQVGKVCSRKLLCAKTSKASLCKNSFV